MTEKPHPKENLAWIDMEMTGLNPDKERIIEVAVIVTDSDLNIIEEGPSLVVNQPNSILNRMDSWNKKHHKASGLIDAVKKSRVDTKKAERLILKFVKKHCVRKKTVLCGNSVYQDRRFIIKYMPKLDAFLHYRLIDVSTIKDLVKRWYPKSKTGPKKKELHRAMDDIRESIEELRFYRKNYFKSAS